MSAPTTTALKVGDKVSVNDRKYPGTWTIKNLGPVNATLTPDHGGRGLRAPYYLLADPVDASEAPAFTPVSFFSEGEIVRIPAGKFTGLYVVIKDGGTDKVNLARLGGDGGRYVRIARSVPVKVDPADVLK